MPAPNENNNKPISRDAKLDVIAAQVNYIADAVKELKTQMTCYEQKHAGEWIEYKVEHAKVVDKVIAVEGDLKEHVGEADKKINTLTDDVRKLRDSIAPLIISNKILVWIGGILGTSVIVFVWSLITHAVNIVAAK